MSRDTRIPPLKMSSFSRFTRDDFVLWLLELDTRAGRLVIGKKIAEIVAEMGAFFSVSHGCWPGEEKGASQR